MVIIRDSNSWGHSGHFYVNKTNRKQKKSAYGFDCGGCITEPQTPDKKGTEDKNLPFTTNI